MIRTIGKWVAFLPLTEESVSGIRSESLEKGIVECETNGLKIGDKIHFDINKVAYKSVDYWIIDADYVYGVVE